MPLQAGSAGKRARSATRASCDRAGSPTVWPPRPAGFAQAGCVKQTTRECRIRCERAGGGPLLAAAQPARLPVNRRLPPAGAAFLPASVMSSHMIIAT